MLTLKLDKLIHILDRVRIVEFVRSIKKFRKDKGRRVTPAFSRAVDNKFYLWDFEDTIPVIKKALDVHLRPYIL